MKKLLLTSILLASACAVSAEITPVKVLGTSLSSHDVAMAVDDNGNVELSVAFYKYDSENAEVSIDIYGDGFKLLKRMNFKGFVAPESFYNPLMDIDEIVATYNWMVKNDKWCVVLYQPTGETDDWGYPLTKSVVVDEDGNILGDCPLRSFEIIFDRVTGGKPYALCDEEYDEDEEGAYIYTFADNGQGGIAAVPVAGMKGYPNPLCGGQTFTVELPRVADSRTVLVVTDMSGRQILRKPVENGSDRAVLRHSRLGHGQFIYTVIYGDGTAGSGKLLSE